MNSRRCECAVTHGITSKDYTLTKVFTCDEHGFICPFCNWQFQKAFDLIDHLEAENGENSIEVCEGFRNHGIYALRESLFELRAYLKVGDDFTLDRSQYELQRSS